MFGSTCWNTIPITLVPLVRAAVTNCSCSTQTREDTVRRATTADIASPIASTADHNDAPWTATTSIASSSTGKAITTSSPAESVSSTQGRAKAARRPMIVPRTAAIATGAGSDDEGDPRAPHQLREQVATESVGSEQVQRARSFETAAAWCRERIRKPEQGDQRHQHDEGP